MQAASPTSQENCVVVIGVGLIGGSIAAALKRRVPSCRVIGIGRSETRLRQAQTAGLIDEWATIIDRVSVPPGCLVVVCLPVDQIASAVRELADCISSESVITDAGSVKSFLYRELADDSAALAAFVGSHPIAGSDQNGWEHASADLFADRICVVTPETSSDDNVRRVSDFWKSLGSHVRIMSADEHDRMLAATSHLPHLMATATTLCVETDQLAYTGTGFRDTTRIAAGSPQVWTPILCGNSEHIVEAIRDAERILGQLRCAVQSADTETVQRLLLSAATRRGQLRNGSGS